MEANPQADQSKYKEKEEELSAATGQAEFLSTFILDSPPKPPFPSPSGAAPQRVQTLERKLDLQKCLNHLHSESQRLIIASKSAQEQLNRLLEIETQLSRTPPPSPSSAITLFDWQKVNQETSSLQKKLNQLKQQQKEIQHKSNFTGQTIHSTLNSLERDFQQAITEHEQEKLILTEQLGQPDLAYDNINKIRQKIAHINQQEATYFRGLNDIIYAAENTAKQSQQLTCTIQHLATEIQQAITALERHPTLTPPPTLNEATPSANTLEKGPSHSARKNELTGLLNSIEQFKEEIETLKTNNKTLSQNYELLQSKHIENDQHTQQLTQDTGLLKRETKALRDSNQQLNTEIREASKEHQALTQKTAKIIQDELKKQTQQQELHQKNLVSKKDLQALFLARDSENTLKDEKLQQQYESHHTKLDKQLESIEQIKTQTKLNQASLSSFSKKLHLQVENSQEENTRLTNEIQQLKKQSVDFENEITPLKKAQQIQNLEHQENLEKSAQQTTQLEILSRELKNKLQSNDQLTEALSTLKEEINIKLEAVTHSQQDCNTSTELQKATNKNAEALIKHLEANFQQQRHSQTALNQQLDTINSTLQASETDKTALNKALKACDQLQLELVESIHHAKETNEALTLSQQAQLESFDHLHNRQNQADKLTLELTELKLFAQQVINKNSSLTEDFSDQLEEIGIKSEAISKLEQNAQIQLTTIHKLHSESEALQHKNETLLQCSQSLSEQLEQKNSYQQKLADAQTSQLQRHQAQHAQQQASAQQLQNESLGWIDEIKNQLKCVEISLSESSQKAEQLDQLSEANLNLNEKTSRLIDTQQFLNDESQRIQNETQTELEGIRASKDELTALQDSLQKTFEQSQQQQQKDLESNKNAYLELQQNHHQALQDLRATKHQHQKTIQESRIQQQQTHKQLDEIKQIQQQYLKQLNQLQNKIKDTEKALQESRDIASKTQQSVDNSASIQESYQHTIETFNQTQQGYLNAIGALQQQPLAQPTPPQQRQPDPSSVEPQQVPPQHTEHQYIKQPIKQQRPQSTPTLPQMPLQEFGWEQLPAANQNQGPSPWYKTPQGILLAVVLAFSLLTSVLVVVNQLNAASPENTTPTNQFGLFPPSSEDANANVKASSFGISAPSFQSSSVESLLAQVMSTRSTPAQIQRALETILLRSDTSPLHGWIKQELHALQQNHHRSQQPTNEGFKEKQFSLSPANHIPSFTWPLKKLRPNPASISYARFRQGITITADKGHSVVSISDGKVIFKGKDMLGTGDLILIQHPDQYISVYGNSRSPAVSPGEHVKKGQVIAQIGDQYPTTLPSLYFEIRYKGNPEDPFYYFSNT